MVKDEIDTSIRFRKRKLTMCHVSLPKYAMCPKIKKIIIIVETIFGPYYF
jgi:hypothetical protein